MDRGDLYPQPAQRFSNKASPHRRSLQQPIAMNDVTNLELTPGGFPEITPHPPTNTAGGFWRSGLCETHVVVCRLLTSLNRSITLPSARRGRGIHSTNSRGKQSNREIGIHAGGSPSLIEAWGLARPPFQDSGSLLSAGDGGRGGGTRGRVESHLLTCSPTNGICPSPRLALL